MSTTDGHPSWYIEPLGSGVNSGCLNCGGRDAVHPLDGMLGVGFGLCGVAKDGEFVWQEDPEAEELPTLRRFEDMAAADPNHDWRVIYDAPMWSGTWQRQGDGTWNLIEKGIGFA